MRRVVGLTLTGLGVFFVVLALLMRFYLPGQIVKFPLNWYSVTTLTGKNLTYFSPSKFKELSGVTMRQMSTLDGDVGAGTSSTAVWNEITGVQDLTNHLPVQYTSQRSAFNRRTGAVINCCGAHVNSNTTARQSGQGYVWPIGTQQQAYQVFNPTLLRAVPTYYQGSATIDGLTTYEFIQQVTGQKIGTQKVPGALFGASQQYVILPEYLTGTYTFWVDPVTGSPLKISEDQTEWLTDAAGATRLVLFQGTLTETPQSTKNLISLTSSYRDKANFLAGAGPLISVLLGILLLAAGISLVATGWDQRRYREYAVGGPGSASGDGRASGDGSASGDLSASRDATA
jgi:Porin PorA